MPQKIPGIGEDVSGLMPAIGADVSHLMDASPAQPAAAPDSSSFVDGAVNFVKGFAHSVDPRPALKLLYDTAQGMAGVSQGRPGDAQAFMDDLKGLGKAQIDQFTKAKQAYHEGRISEAVGHTIAGALPLVGPAAANAGEKIGAGNVAEGLGEGAGLIAGMKAPAIVSKVVPKSISSGFGGIVNPNPVAAEAVAFGERAGIPIDAATATGSDVIRSVQKKVSDSMGGAGIAERFKAQQAQKLASVGEQLAAKANQGGPTVTPLQAGEAAQGAVRDVVHGKNVEATTAYDKLRDLAEQNRETVETRAPQPAPDGSAAMFTTRGNALPDDVFESAYADAKTNGYNGTRGDLRRRFDEELSSGFRAYEDKAATEAEYGPQALLSSIKKLGGLRPFDTEIGSGRKLSGDFASLHETFKSDAWGQKGRGVFRDQGLALDDMVDQLRQDPRWKHIIADDHDLLNVLDEVGRDGPVGKNAKPTVEQALMLTEARPGAQWWTKRTEADLALPVDLRSVKSVLQPTYQRLMREAQIAPASVMGDKATALKALDRLMTAPDQAPLTEVDAALSDLKSFARADNPDLRSIGQGVVANAVKHLDGLVRGTAAKAGPDVLAALEQGRKATQEKYSAAAVLDGLETGRGEAVQAYKRLTAPGDSAVGQLRDVLTQAPQTAPHLARATLDELLTKATAGGSFEHAAAINESWRKLGPETKQLLYKDPAYISDLDNYFRLAKKIAENPNPSGTARINNLFNAASAAVGYPVAKLVYSPAGVKLLTQGLRLPVQSPTLMAAYTTRLTAALQQAKALDPAMADERREETPTTIGRR